ncbi:hypothetical protein W97_08800 [Coniosporium apollinis CBS 100218]|uniref:PH domain-containing protein n=1 Tax=Coniosporium apollinis (strain CBS 100218) TaxID=1168221 RepID=R7Z5T3_CONA1|nr:uncharacterized protein W97_08800 [Coniosporium apollinis CBS 100218]EON69540.1 hypothetical protein W97_08800 [Coniosporium apollinis CBS 100218]
MAVATANARSASVGGADQIPSAAGRPGGPRTINYTSPSKTSAYGYYNTFHTHSLPSTPETLPPTYDTAVTTTPRPTNREVLPRYTCSVNHEGAGSMKSELYTPFLMTIQQQWQDVYFVLRGTQLSIYKLKTSTFGRPVKPAAPGRLIETYTLQHAEVGLATDYSKGCLRPKRGLVRLLPSSTWQKVYESDPQLFEPVREFVIRLRLEAEQFVFSVGTQEQMLDWVEKICAAIDISPPLESRSEPRYRTMPRRSRRQRHLDTRTLQNLDNLESLAEGVRILREQERILREMYPQLTEGGADAAEAGPPVADSPTNDAGADADTYDREDFLFPTNSLRPGSAPPATAPAPASQQPALAALTTTQIPSYNPKTAAPRTSSAAQTLRYRRRCCPVLLYHSSRASPVVMRRGVRMRLDRERQLLVEFEEHPPKYDAHGFSAVERAAALNAQAAPEARARPQIQRAQTHDSDSSSVVADDGSVDAQGRADMIGDELSRSVTEDATPPPSPGFASGRAKEAMTVTVGGKSITVPHPEHVGFGFAMGLGGRGIVGV